LAIRSTAGPLVCGAPVGDVFDCKVPLGDLGQVDGFQKPLRFRVPGRFAEEDTQWLDKTTLDVRNTKKNNKTNPCGFFSFRTSFEVAFA
jgi:hypothetical protein